MPKGYCFECISAEEEFSVKNFIESLSEYSIAELEKTEGSVLWGNPSTIDCELITLEALQKFWDKKKTVLFFVTFKSHSVKISLGGGLGKTVAAAYDIHTLSEDEKLEFIHELSIRFIRNHLSRESYFVYDIRNAEEENDWDMLYFCEDEVESYPQGIILSKEKYEEIKSLPLFKECNLTDKGDYIDVKYY